MVKKIAIDPISDVKSRINLDNIQTMAEAKQGMRVLIDLAIELKKKECSLNMKSIELENTPSENHPEKIAYDEKLREIERQHCTVLNNVEQEYQEKIAILLGQLRGVESKGENCYIILFIANQNFDLLHRIATFQLFSNYF